MTIGVKLLRALFVATEVGTVAGTVIFLAFDELTAHRSKVGSGLGVVFIGMYIGLLFVSIALRRSERKLSDIGLITCFVAFLIGAISPRL